MALSNSEIADLVTKLRFAVRARDQRNKDVRDIRSGDVDTIMPGAMPDAWPKPIVANLIDTTARDISETMGVMPSINCTSGVITSQAAKKFSAKRTKIAHYWVQRSQLPSGKQVEFCDSYMSYGMGVYCVEPDFESQMPVIRVENPIGIYPQWNLFGKLVSYSKVWYEEAVHLVAKHPALRRVLCPNNSNDNTWASREIEICKYVDADQIVMFLPGHSNQVVSSMPNPMGKVTISIAVRPGFDKEIRGAWDDAIWVQLAKGRMALLGLEATEKTIRAPLAVPRDVQQMTFGDDAIIRTDSPDKIRRVGLDVPQAATQEQEMLEQELYKSVRYNEARSGSIDASIITGKGVQALMGNFNMVITTGQQVASEALRCAIEMAFDMDEKLWPDVQKTIRGMVNGTPFEESYTPVKDIHGVHTVDVTYGFAAGQDPARAIVALLQLRGDQLVSRDFVQRQLPMDIDIVQLQTQIDNEQITDAIKQGLMAYLQQIGIMASQGQDPTTLLKEAAQVIKLREKGTPLHEAVLEAFTPKPAPGAPPGQPGSAGGPGMAPGAGGPGQPGLPPGFEQSGLPQGVAPGQAGQGPGGRADLMSLLAGMSSSGQPNLSATINRRGPAG
jgi:hypothetical protein